MPIYYFVPLYYCHYRMCFMGCPLSMAVPKEHKGKKQTASEQNDQLASLFSFHVILSYVYKIGRVGSSHQAARP